MGHVTISVFVFSKQQNNNIFGLIELSRGDIHQLCNWFIYVLARITHFKTGLFGVPDLLEISSGDLFYKNNRFFQEPYKQ